MKDSAIITMVQLVDPTGNGVDAVRRMPKFFEEAKEKGADLIAFPEYILGQKVTLETPHVRAFFDLAKEHGIYAVAGMVEEHPDRQTSVTALVVDRQGNLLGRYYKSHPAGGPQPHDWPPVPGNDQEARGMLGSGFKVFTLDFGTIGILQCYDGFFPEAWGCTSYMGAEIILWINGRRGVVEDGFCHTAAVCYGCIAAANISNGRNTGFAGCGCVTPLDDQPWEEARLWPRILEEGDACVHGRCDLAKLRVRRKHLRFMHQRRPEMYGMLTRDVTMWQDYPDIPWAHPDCSDLVNRAQL